MTVFDEPPTGPDNSHRPFHNVKAHPSRRYDYWLGGKDNFAPDRASADRIAREFPTVRLAAIENRRLLHRAVSYLTRHAGIRQYIDIGTGIPTSPNVHEIAQRLTPDARVAYVDNDSLVVTHARARMIGSPEGHITYLRADLRQPETILTHPALRDTIDFDQPIGLLLIAVLHFLTDTDNPYQTVTQLVEALPTGSFLALTHATLDPLPTPAADHLAALAAPGSGHGPFRFRTRAEVARFLDGLEPVDPGLVPIVDWRPDDEPHPRATVEQSAGYAAIARVPPRRGGLGGDRCGTL